MARKRSFANLICINFLSRDKGSCVGKYLLSSYRANQGCVKHKQGFIGGRGCSPNTHKTGTCLGDKSCKRDNSRQCVIVHNNFSYQELWVIILELTFGNQAPQGGFISLLFPAFGICLYQGT